MRKLYAVVAGTALAVFTAGGANASYKDRTHCPKGMTQIEGKFCIDRYEYPNRAGDYSLNMVSWEQAASLCAQEDKRLCSAEEWKTACKGPKKTKYPYGDEYLKGACSDANSPDGIGHYPSGAWEACSNEFEIYDMSGNLWEWTSDGYADGKKSVRGGSAVSDNPDALSCSAVAREDVKTTDGYIGFRCCKDLSATNVRVAISPLVGFLPANDESGFYHGSEYTSFEDIVNAPGYDTYVSAGGWNLTAGYQFKEGRLDYTRIDYRVSAMEFGYSDSSHASANVFHAAYLLPVPADFKQWTGPLSLGGRVLDCKWGSIAEAYLSKEFNSDRWSITPGVNYLSSPEVGDTSGYSLELRYQFTSYLNLFGVYSTSDFYKTYIQ